MGVLKKFDVEKELHHTIEDMCDLLRVSEQPEAVQMMERAINAAYAAGCYEGARRMKELVLDKLGREP
jgi:enoyl-CoA hydratase/carnithine racemase